MKKTGLIFFLTILFIDSVIAGIYTKKSEWDLSKDKVLYTVSYSHLDTQWRWDYQKTINDYIKATIRDNFRYLEKYPEYTFNFTGSTRYEMMKEYYPKDYEKLASAPRPSSPCTPHGVRVLQCPAPTRRASWRRAQAWGGWRANEEREEGAARGSSHRAAGSRYAGGRRRRGAHRRRADRARTCPSRHWTLHHQERAQAPASSTTVP
jgi:hypothetical protein